MGTARPEQELAQSLWQDTQTRPQVPGTAQPGAGLEPGSAEAPVRLPLPPEPQPCPAGASAGSAAAARRALPRSAPAAPLPGAGAGTRLPGQGALAGARQPPQQHQPPSAAGPRGPQAQPPQGPQQPLLHGRGAGAGPGGARGRARPGMGGPGQPLRSPAPAPAPGPTPAPLPSAPAGGAGPERASLHGPGGRDSAPRKRKRPGAETRARTGICAFTATALGYGTRCRPGTLARDTISKYLKSGLFTKFSKAGEHKPALAVFSHCLSVLRATGQARKRMNHPSPKEKRGWIQDTRYARRLFSSSPPAPSLETLSESSSTTEAKRMPRGRS